jgi:hypothetical protein
MVGARKSITSRFKPTDIFQRRIVITVPRSGALIITLAILFGLRYALPVLWSAVAIVTSIVAIVTIVEARHQLRTFRYDVVARLNSTIATYQIPDEDIRIAHELGLIDDDEDEDDALRIRLRPTRYR